MSFELLVQALKVDLPCVQKMVVIHLADMHNDDEGHAWPSVATLAKRCGVSKRTVQRTLGELVEMASGPRGGPGLPHDHAGGCMISRRRRDPGHPAARRVLRSLPDGLNYPADVGRILRMIEPTRWDRDR